MLFVLFFVVVVPGVIAYYLGWYWPNRRVTPQ
jgi:hypothetical protein